MMIILKNMYVILEISFLSHLFFLTSRWTPLIIASSAGHEDIVHLLLGAGKWKYLRFPESKIPTTFFMHYTFQGLRLMHARIRAAHPFSMLVQRITNLLQKCF